MKFMPWVPALLLSFTLRSPVAAQQTSVALLVDAKFKTALESEINRLAADIESDLSTTVITHAIDVDTSAPESIRAKIKNLYQTRGLLGSILIGDMPAVRFGDAYGNPPFWTDAFYEDLGDDCWADPDGNGIYNSAIDENGDGTYDYFLKTWIAEHNREVWSGRLQPPSSVPLSERIALLRRYLDRDHLFRTGGISYRRGLIYSENVSSDDSATIAGRAVAVFEGSWLYHPERGDTLIECSASTPAARRDRWTTAVRDSVEYAMINVHGTTTSQYFGPGIWLYNSDYRNIGVNACMVDLASCSNGDFSEPDYLAGWVLFSGAALMVRANTSPTMYVGTPRPDPDQRLLSLGQTFGEVRLADVLSNDSGTLFGDPTLRLRNRGTGPVLDHDTTTTVLATEALQSSPGNYQGGTVRLKNLGDQPIQTFLRIRSLTSISHKYRDVQCSFSLPEFKESFLSDVPWIIQPGTTISTPVTFAYEAPPPGNTTGVPVYLGTFRAKACFYTDSPTTPFFWLSFEKTITPVEPDMPRLAIPADHQLSQPTSLTLIWNRSARAATYHVQLSTDEHFGSFAVNDSTVSDTMLRVLGLANNTIYFWRVRALNPMGASVFSVPWTFTTVVARPGVPEMVAPVNGAESQPISLTLRWTRVIGATGYQVQVSAESTFSGAVVNDSLLADTTRLILKLGNGTTYYWRVRAMNAGGPSSYADPFTFTTIVALPDQVNLITPLQGARMAADKIALSWRAATPAILSYELELIGDSTTTRATVDTTLVLFLPPGSGEKAYSWRVRARNLAGFGKFSTTWTFIRLTTGVEGSQNTPKEFVLEQNHPNPFNPSTTIRYGLPERSVVRLEVFNMLGQSVAVLAREEQPAGYYEVRFEAGGLPAGVYFCCIRAGSYRATKKLLLVR